jgi:hypothetical protein
MAAYEPRVGILSTMRPTALGSLGFAFLSIVATAANAADKPATAPSAIRLAWKDDYLSLSSPDIPGGPIKIHYLEAYCRPGSTHRKWQETMIGHKTRLVSADADGRHLVLECTLTDGVTVRHEIRSTADEVDFRLTATNPTTKPSEAHWAQPCIRVGPFTGGDERTYLPKCFIFQGGRLARMPTADWATEALYTPGQVWRARNLDRNDVNPRPLNPNVPDNGLIGCFSADESRIFAVAFDPWQELFQGVAACIHSDFRIGGLAPGETKRIHGKMYILPNDVPALLERYKKDFPEPPRK